MSSLNGTLMMSRCWITTTWSGTMPQIIIKR